MLPVCFALSLCVTAAAAVQGAWESTTATPRRIETAEGSETLRFGLEIFSKTFVLDLESDRTFLAPGFVVHTVGKPESPEENRRPGLDSSTDARCFYSGTVNGEKNSAAALNVCRGLQGAFYVGGEEFSIQPANTTTGEGPPSSEGVHVVRRRRRRLVEDETGSKCGVNEYEEKLPKRQTHQFTTSPPQSPGTFQTFYLGVECETTPNQILCFALF